MTFRIPFSVLNLATYPQGAPISHAFENAVRIAQMAEIWGYRRFWLAEHHNIEGVASAATSILIGHIASKTKTLRVGSGGIMLPNHAPLVIAEQFGTLETLYPGRIDLGLGRAPGADGLTMRALRANTPSQGDDFPDLIEELRAYLAPAREGQRLRAIPGAGLDIPIWILGSSLYSAQLAAVLGLPYAFAGHFAPAQMMEAFRIYRAQFQPSKDLLKPYVVVTAPVIAADTDARAEILATSLYQRFVGIIRGSRSGTPPPVSSMEGLWDASEKYQADAMLRLLVVGGPEKVRAGLEDLVRHTGADELMISCELFDPEDTLRSYEIIGHL